MDKTTLDSRALIYGFSVDTDGRVTELNWQSLSSLDINKPGRWHWIHLNRFSVVQPL